MIPSEIQRRHYKDHNTPLLAGLLTKARRAAVTQYDSHGVYCGLSTASEVFLIFTTQLYQYFSVFYLH